MGNSSTCGPASRRSIPSRASTASTRPTSAADCAGGGLYTQRKEGYDGTFTGEENVDPHRSPYFMLRVRSDGGALTARSLRTLGQISTEFARDTADISDRQNVQYHWIRIEDMPEIWRRLDEVGLQTTEACGDCPRVVLGSPLAGESLDGVLDATPAVEEIAHAATSESRSTPTCRKFKTAISGLQDVVHEINDVLFVGVHPEHGPGLIRGSVADCPPTRCWVSASEHGCPRMRCRTFRGGGGQPVPRLRLPTTSRQGPAEVPGQGLGVRRNSAKFSKREYLKRPLIDGPAPEPVVHPIDHVGVQRLRNGLNAVGVAPIVGRCRALSACPNN